MQTAKPSGPISPHDWIQFSKAVLTHAHGRETPWVCGWPVHIIYTAYYSTLPYLLFSHIHMFGHGIPAAWGYDNFSASHSKIINFKGPSNSQLWYPRQQADVVQCSSPPLHMQASPEGRVKRHLLPFPPAAAENNWGQTQRLWLETVPKEQATHSYCVYTLLCAV